MNFKGRAFTFGKNWVIPTSFLRTQSLQRHLSWKWQGGTGLRGSCRLEIDDRTILHVNCCPRMHCWKMNPSVPQHQCTLGLPLVFVRNKSTRRFRLMFCLPRSLLGPGTVRHLNFKVKTTFRQQFCQRQLARFVRVLLTKQTEVIVNKKAAGNDFKKGPVIWLPLYCSSLQQCIISKRGRRYCNKPVGCYSVLQCCYPYVITNPLHGMQCIFIIVQQLHLREYLYQVGRYCDAYPRSTVQSNLISSITNC